jgi:hypothetical protein
VPVIVAIRALVRHGVEIGRHGAGRAA